MFIDGVLGRELSHSGVLRILKLTVAQNASWYCSSMAKKPSCHNGLGSTYLVVVGAEFYRVGNIIKVFPTRDVQTMTKYGYVLPEQQERLVEIVTEIASESGFGLEVIDVAQMDYFDKPIPKEVKELNDFPVLAIDSQVQLALDFSREDIERFLPHVRREEKRV